jgi:hypothetical protein
MGRDFMKKIFIGLIILCSSLFGKAFAVEKGILIQEGVSVPCIIFGGIPKAYVYEQISYNYKWDSGAYIGLDFRVMANVVKNQNESALYFAIGETQGVGNFYTSYGLLFHDALKKNESFATLYFRGGFRRDFWPSGAGKFGLDIGGDFSATYFYISGFDDQGDYAPLAWGILGLANLLNWLKLNIGVTYYLPL